MIRLGTIQKTLLEAFRNVPRSCHYFEGGPDFANLPMEDIQISLYINYNKNRTAQIRPYNTYKGGLKIVWRGGTIILPILRGMHSFCQSSGGIRLHL